MTALVSDSFLSMIKSLYPPAASQNPWYIVAAVAFSASNKAEAVPLVFQYALRELEAKSEARFLLAQKIREALFKSGLISGYPKAINSLVALHGAMPGDLKEKSIQRDIHASLAEYERIGERLWRTVYGEISDEVQELLNDIHPDMGYFSRTIGYGFTYGHTDVLSVLETSYTMVAALIAGDTPQQISWHLKGARRGGASFDEVKAVRQISIEVATLCGIIWSNDVPEVPDELPKGQ